MTETSAPPQIDAACMRRLRAQARRLVRCAADAEDLVQDVLVAAVIAGRADPAWLAGTLRRQAAFAARGAVRRRRREQAAGPSLHAPSPGPVEAPPTLPPMPPAARRVARLALHGLGADEIRWLLRITPQAFRQRLVSSGARSRPRPDRCRRDCARSPPRPRPAA